MFAYLKYQAKCTHHAEKDTISTSQIKNFDAKNFNIRKLYRVKCKDKYCTATVIFVEDNLEKLKRTIVEQRPKIPPKNLLESASDATSADETSVLVRKDPGNDSTRDMLAKKLKTFDPNARDVPKSRGAKTDVQKKTDKSQMKPPLEPTKGGDSSKENKDPKKDEPFDPTDREENSSVRKELANLRTKLQQTQNEVESQKTVIDRLRSLLRDQKSQNAQLSRLNVELQKNVIDCFGELKTSLAEMGKDQANAQLNDSIIPNSLPVAYIRSRDNTIHLGRDIWISKPKYDAVICNARSPAMFVKNLAVAVYGYETLAASTVLGKLSNRTKKDGNKIARPKLDSTRLLAIKDIFRYWLANTKKLDSVSIDNYASQVGNYISHKINDLNRAKGASTSASTINSTQVVGVETLTANLLDEEDEQITEQRSDGSVSPETVMGEIEDEIADENGKPRDDSGKVSDQDDDL